MRRSNGSGSHDSFRRRSIKLKKNEKRTPNKKVPSFADDEYKTEHFKRSNSLRSRRRISGVSEKSDTSERLSEEESPGLLSEDGHSFESQMDTDANDHENITSLPWLKIPEMMANVLDFTCAHSGVCSQNCYKKVSKSTSYLIKEVQKVYDKDVPIFFDTDLLTQKLIDDKDDAVKKEKKLKKILMGHSSPLRRKISGKFIQFIFYRTPN